MPTSRTVVLCQGQDGRRALGSGKLCSCASGGEVASVEGPDAERGSRDSGCCDQCSLVQ
jgi:hypothetical protein